MRLKDPMPSLEGITGVIGGENKIEFALEKGKPVLFHFWAVSCHLCKKGMPHINVLRDEYENELQVVSVYSPRKEEDYEQEAIFNVINEHKLTHPTLLDLKLQVKEHWDNKYVPAYYLFDHKGQLRHYQAGGTTMSMVEKRVQRIMNEMKEELECVTNKDGE